ncbi:unnamed protein product [Amoebophrya sp. A120]|nr:unnamed protein product [Amoebophrya sp. A120]|eukprot:GSA120T00025231001.1
MSGSTNPLIAADWIPCRRDEWRLNSLRVQEYEHLVRARDPQNGLRFSYAEGDVGSTAAENKSNPKHWRCQCQGIVGEMTIEMENVEVFFISGDKTCFFRGDLRAEFLDPENMATAARVDSLTHGVYRGPVDLCVFEAELGEAEPPGREEDTQDVVKTAVFLRVSSATSGLLEYWTTATPARLNITHLNTYPHSRAAEQQKSFDGLLSSSPPGAGAGSRAWYRVENKKVLRTKLYRRSTAAGYNYT